MPEASPQTQAAPAAADLRTLIALSLAAGAMTAVFHEGLGHGGACWLSGGQNLLISSMSENCSLANPWISAAGTLVNLAAGLVFWLLLRRRTAASTRYFFGLGMSFNLLTAAGYWLYSGVANLGDWADVLAGLQPAWLWHTGMALIGAGLYWFWVRLTARELKPLLPAEATPREQAVYARGLMLVPYFTFAALEIGAGVFNPGRALLLAESAAAVSLGGLSGLCWGWRFVYSPYFRQPGPALPPLTRSRNWLIAGSLAAAAFIALLGPGWRP